MKLAAFKQTVKSKRFHVSWLIAWSSIGILLGAVFIRFIEPARYAGFDWLLIALCVFFAAYIKRSVIALLLAFTAGVFLGLYVGAAKLITLEPLIALHGSQQTITGTIRNDTTRGPSGDQRFRMADLHVGSTPMTGAIWVSTAADTELKRGDVITVSGELSEGFGTMQASLFRATLENVTRPEPGDVARAARDGFSDKVRQFIHDPMANIGVSFLVGQRSGLPDDVQDMFRDLGLVHLVVASGFHLTIVVRFSRRLFVARSKYMALVSSLGLIGGFLLLTGFSTSMIRASLVTALSLLAWYVGRNIHPLVLLPFVAAITVIINPLYIWSDLAWYLSFTAFTGVIILAPLIQKYFWNPDKEPGFVRYLIIATLSAQLLTFPIIALAFEQFSPLAILANLLVLPFVPFAMLGTFVTGIIGYLIPWLANVAAAITSIGLSYINAVVEYLSGLPWATGHVSISPVFIAVFYVGILMFMYYLQRTTGHSLRTENPVE